MWGVAKVPVPAIRHFASRLRFPKLFALTLVLLTIDLVVPDVVPFVDEILLALIAALLGTVRTRGRGGEESDDQAES